MVFIMTLMIGGILSHFASSNPDGLEWAVEKVASEALKRLKNHQLLKVL